jgi:uncharacterized protein
LADGQGVPQDYEAAINWYRKAADQDGFAQKAARFFLGYMYETGKGVPQNYVLAHMWYNLAAAKGDKDDAENRDRVAAKMIPAQIAEAQRLAREWKPTSIPR